jgi:hypothetical protein
LAYLLPPDAENKNTALEFEPQHDRPICYHDHEPTVSPKTCVENNDKTSPENVILYSPQTVSAFPISCSSFEQYIEQQRTAVTASVHVPEAPGISGHYHTTSSQTRALYLRMVYCMASSKINNADQIIPREWPLKLPMLMEHYQLAKLIELRRILSIDF